MTLIKLKEKPFYLDDSAIEWVTETLNGMTQEQKIGQLFCMNIRNFGDSVLDYMYGIVEPGAVMYRPQNAKEEIAFTKKLQNRSKIPLLIAANLEKGGGGIVMEGTQIGSPMAAAATGDPETAGKMAYICAKEGKEVGANWAFAPIIDIDYNWRNPITNTRTFGSDQERVKAMGVSYVKTIQENQVAACIKHFPGDGMDERDQHLLSSVNTMSCEEWDATYGKAYQACIDAGAMTCMVGHIMQPAYSKALNPELRDEDILPGSMSQELLGGLLRGKLGFNGMICSDATTMAGYTIPMPREEALPHSVAAGIDMILFTRNMEEDVNAIRKGVENGTITEERLDEAVTRILAVKAALKLHHGVRELSEERASQVIGCQEFKHFAKECADKAITLVKDKEGILPLNPKKHKRILFYPIEGKTDLIYGVVAGAVQKIKDALLREGFEVTEFVPDPNREGFAKSFEYYKENYDLCLYVANLATKSNQTVVRIEWQEPMGANCPHFEASIPTMFISISNPYHLADVPRVKTFINTYGADDATIDALIEKIMGRSEFKGISPVDAFCGKWDTRL